MPKVFISYSSKEPDATIAENFQNGLKNGGIDTFFAPHNLEIGEEWSKRISEEIKSFDYFLVFLSENSLGSEMVTEEIRRAVKHFKESERKPGILPVRINLDFAKSINYDIDSYLQPFQHRLWEDEKDSDKILDEILSVIKKKQNNSNNNDEVPEAEKQIEFVPTGAEPVPRPNAAIIFTGGMVAFDCPYYVVRKAEKDNISHIKEPGALISIFAPRQYGKTSLLFRLTQEARKNGDEIIAMNFQQRLEEKQLQDLDLLLKQVCIFSAKEIGLRFKDFKEVLDEKWEEPITSKMKCGEFFESFILKKTDKDIVLAFDEADRLFRYREVSSDFFGMIRAWHEDAKLDPVFRRIKLIVVYATEASLAINDVNQSPFNVGCEIKLPEFTFDEIKKLSEKYELAYTDGQLKQITDLIGGHPYLIRKAFSHLYNNEFTLKKLVDTACTDDGPFGDHLKKTYLMISEKPELFGSFKNIMLNKKSLTDLAGFRLKAAGLVDGELPNLTVKLPIYEQYFKSKI